VRRCLERGLRVYLLEWLIPGPEEDGYGLAQYADRLPGAALDAVAREIGSEPPILAGHSLGGTLAAIFACLHPERVGGLVLLDGPLAFGEHGGPLARAVKTIPNARVLRGTPGTPVSGSKINLFSAGAAPEAFQFQRVADLLASLSNREALAIHARVERWTYDEFPLPGQLFEEILERLYREDRLLRGTLAVGERTAGIRDLRGPVIAVVNPVGRIVPPESILAGLEAVPNLAFQVLQYEGGPGPMLQHLGPLVAPVAHDRIWPKIIDWLDAEPRGSRGGG
jgi:polyhydroxyalkanoate synthase subunit PhaC